MDPAAIAGALLADFAVWAGAAAGDSFAFGWGAGVTVFLVSTVCFGASFFLAAGAAVLGAAAAFVTVFAVLDATAFAALAACSFLTCCSAAFAAARAFSEALGEADFFTLLVLALAETALTREALLLDDDFGLEMAVFVVRVLAAVLERAVLFAAFRALDRAAAILTYSCSSPALETGRSRGGGTSRSS